MFGIHLQMGRLQRARTEAEQGLHASELLLPLQALGDEHALSHRRVEEELGPRRLLFLVLQADPQVFQLGLDYV